MLERDFGYKPPIPEDLQSQYESALTKVERWRGGNWSDSVYETNMDHVAGMFVVLEDINRTCPTVPNEIDTETVKHIIYLHDSGEILVGDLTHGRDDYDTLHDKWKNRERAAARLLTGRIEDEKTKLKARKLYERYVLKKGDDKEALLTDFIDKVQGSRFGFRNVFHGRGMRKANREMQFNHTIQLLIKPTKPLLNLVTPATQEGLKNFLAGELERFSQYGYKNEVEPYIKNLDTILS